jgi:ubiquinone/menaquinone biosynthesis C-methylase UbiE
MAADTYERLAARYDRMHRENPAREAFFRDLFTRHGVKRVLDCACGTGCDLIAFAKLGFEVEGSDLSKAMLVQARTNLTEAGLAVPLHCLDFRELDQHFDASFDAVVCPTNSINEILDEEEAVKGLRSMRAVLRPGGIVVIDQGQTNASMREPRLYDVVVNDPDLTRLLVMKYDADLMTVHVLDAVHTEEEQTVEGTVVRLKIRLRDDWEQLFEEAGFSGVEFLGNWAGGTYDDRAERLIVVGAV